MRRRHGVHDHGGDQNIVVYQPLSGTPSSVEPAESSGPGASLSSWRCRGGEAPLTGGGTSY